MPIRNYVLNKNLNKKLKKLERKVDAVGPTPIRQIIESCVVFASDRLQEFDEKRFENDKVYAENMRVLNSKFQDLLNEIDTEFENANDE